uniref:DUF4340 domain-containing protein n=1 Tax=Tahibacter caeni TaxID=1453545 RepID=UPI0021484B29
IAAAAAIAIAAGISLSRKPVADAAHGAGEALPGLAEHVNDVTRFSLTGPGQKLLATLEKGEQGWSLKEKGGYRADAGKVREFLLRLSQSRLLEQKTANEQRYSDIGVTDIGASDAKGLLVALDGLPQPAQLIVGIMNPRGDATYVRRAGEKQSWLAKGNLIPDKTAANWLDKRIVDLPAMRVREVAWSRPDGKAARVFKAQPGDTNYALADLPRGRELSSEFAANTQATTLAGLNFDDVFAAADAPAPADGKVYRATFASFDGVVVALTGWKKDEKFHAQFQARRDEAAFEAGLSAAQAKAKADWDAQQAAATADSAKPAAAPPLAVADPAKDRSERSAAVDAEVAELGRRFAGWTFVLPAYKAASFDKTADEFLKPLDDKKADAKKPAAK